MKKFLLLIFSLFHICFAANCQTYNVSVTQYPYVELTGGQPLVTGTWDDPEFDVPVGFTFDLFEDSISTLYSADFFAGGYFSSSLDFTATNIIVAFSTDLIDRGFEIDSALSPILFKTEGVPGNRVFTLEFKNAGFWGGEVENEIYTDFINFQLRIREESGDIEVHIGPYSVQNPGLNFEGFSGPAIGMLEDFNFDDGSILGEIIVLAGDPSNPDNITDFSPANLIWPIPENTVYIFSRNTTKTEENRIAKSELFYYPNPSSGNLSLFPALQEKIISPVYIFNASGALMMTDNDTEIIQLENLGAGVYELQFQTSTGFAYQRIIHMK